MPSRMRAVGDSDCRVSRPATTTFVSMTAAVIFIAGERLASP